MNRKCTYDSDFLTQLREIIRNNIKDPQFGVSSLAREVGMSRSNLHKKVSALTKISVNQFIRHERLKAGLKMLKRTSLTVSEVAYEVGFSHVSYFIKRFHEYYGFSPGHVGVREQEEKEVKTGRKLKPVYFIGLSIILVSLITFVVSLKSPENKTNKSIAVLYPEYINPDSITNGLAEGTMSGVHDKLSIIEDLTVVPRRSLIKYKDSDKSYPEIQKELNNVSFFLESEVFSTGDNILLNIELNKENKQLDYHVFTLSGGNQFQLQEEITKWVADELGAKISQENLKRIETKPTTSENAYKLYVDAREIVDKTGNESYTNESRIELLEKAADYLKKAIEIDSEFALACAELAKVYGFLYYYTDTHQYTTLMNKNADLALTLDDESDQSWIAKGWYYYVIRDRDMAIRFFNKALLLNPNSYDALSGLKYIYRYQEPDTQKRIELNLRLIKLETAGKDSGEISEIYVDLSDSFANAGFPAEAKTYLEKALEYNPDNIKAVVKLEAGYYKMEWDYKKMISIANSLPDSGFSNQWLLNEMADAYSKLKDYKASVHCFKELKKKFPLYRTPFRFTYYTTLQELDMATDSAINEIEERKNRIDTLNINLNDHIFLVKYYAIKNDKEKTFEYFHSFSQLKNYPFVHVIYTLNEVNPVFKTYRNLPEFKKITKNIEDKFRADHKQIKVSLKEKGLL